ncbi:MAG: exopolysaccharide biosynthesis protein [Phenylobacterium sp.]|nr:MAG: exopolysaccharide biosynthesis protein [Phenylobacterium sp.]
MTESLSLGVTSSRARDRLAVAASRRKRAFDITVAALALGFLLPFLLLLWAVIRLDSPGPALFRQRRTGLNGQPFDILKFRTMRASAEPATVQQACRGDARVTRVGRVLRKLSLDELPQLMNILRGEMSLVGPRPHALAHDTAWSELVPTYNHRFRAKPGLTGEAQVDGLRGEISSADLLIARIEADNRYIDHWSFARDLAIVLRTAPLLLGDRSAF